MSEVVGACVLIGLWLLFREEKPKTPPPNAFTVTSMSSDDFLDFYLDTMAQRDEASEREE